jgi:hypothetical protein
MTIHQFLQRVFVQPAARERLAQLLRQLGWIGFGLSALKFGFTGNYGYAISMALWPLVLFPAAALLAEHTPSP